MGKKSQRVGNSLIVPEENDRKVRDLRVKSSGSQHKKQEYDFWRKNAWHNICLSRTHSFFGGQMFQQLEAAMFSLQWTFRGDFYSYQESFLPTLWSINHILRKQRLWLAKQLSCATAEGGMSLLPWKLCWVPKVESLELQNLPLWRYLCHPKKKEISIEIYKL